MITIYDMTIQCGAHSKTSISCAAKRKRERTRLFFPPGRKMLNSENSTFQFDGVFYYPFDVIKKNRSSYTENCFCPVIFATISLHCFRRMLRCWWIGISISNATFDIDYTFDEFIFFYKMKKRQHQPFQLLRLFWYPTQRNVLFENIAFDLLLHNFSVHIECMEKCIKSTFKSINCLLATVIYFWVCDSSSTWVLMMNFWDAFTALNTVKWIDRVLCL